MELLNDLLQRTTGGLRDIDAAVDAKVVEDWIDHAPDDLYRQTPLRGLLLRTIAKHDRSDRRIRCD